MGLNCTRHVACRYHGGTGSRPRLRAVSLHVIVVCVVDRWLYTRTLLALARRPFFHAGAVRRVAAVGCDVRGALFRSGAEPGAGGGAVRRLMRLAWHEP
eukprot:6971255-Prymnesium_polylepis.1